MMVGANFKIHTTIPIFCTLFPGSPLKAVQSEKDESYILKEADCKGNGIYCCFLYTRYKVSPVSSS